MEAPSAVEARSITSASGLFYTELRIGDGSSPQPGQVAFVHYTAWLEDGTPVDSSHSPGRPPYRFTLGRGQVIAGWEEGIATMRIGGKRRLTIPPALAYGADGFEETIPPNATLVFEVELLDVQ